METSPKAMAIIEITDPTVMIDLMEAMSNIVGMHDALMTDRDRPLNSLRVGIDPLDNGVKFSVEHSTWSPPYKGDITP